MKRIILRIAGLTAATAFLHGAGSAMQAPAGPPPERVRQLVVYGNDPCPQSDPDEIVVCARKPETERYRIPKELRETEKEGESQSWAARAEAIEYMGRSGIQSCSPVGPGGFTGCLDQMLREWRAERRAGLVPPR